jgi:hypothetical protein
MRKIVAALFILLVIAIAFLVYFFSNGIPWFQRRNTSNSWIMDKPTIEDERPKSVYGMDKQWWAWYGYVYSDKEDELLLNANIYPKPVATLYGNSYTFNGEMETYNFNEDVAWDEQTKTLYGTMVRESDNAVGTWKLTFVDNGYRVYEQEAPNDKLKLEMKSRGIPLWGAKTDDQMLQIGWRQLTPVYGGGFHDCVYITATLVKDGEQKIFKGWGMYARAWIKPVRQSAGEAAVGFINQQPEFYINFMYVRNTRDLSEVFVKAGRIGFPDKAYTFDDFTYTGDKYPELKWFKLTGRYEGGEVNLSGVNMGFLHYRQHHPLVLWTGTITRNGKTINVNSLGSGEFRQIN